MTVIHTTLYRKVKISDTYDNGAIIEITNTETGECLDARLNEGELAQLREALKVPSSAEFYDAEGDKWKLADGRLYLMGNDGTYPGLDHPWDVVNEEYGPLAPVQSVDTKYVVGLDAGYLADPGITDNLEDAAMFDTKEQARAFLFERERQIRGMGGEIAEAQVSEVRGTYQGWWHV